VNPVTDTPIIDISLGESYVESGNITIANVNDTDSGFTVTAYNINGDETTVSTHTNGSGTVQGFGVNGWAPDGAFKELQQKNGVSEKLVITFDQPVAEVSMAFSWLSSIEHAHYVLKDPSGNIVGEETVKGVSDRIDGVFSVGNSLIGSIEFTAPGKENGGSKKDDYLVHMVGFTSGEIFPVDIIMAQATDTDLSESIISLSISTPEGVLLSHGTLVETSGGISTWSLPLESDADYTYTYDESTDTAIVNGLSMSVPADFDGDIAITATVTAQDGTAPTASSSDSIDILRGGDGDDILTGGTGDDQLFGGAGDDTMTGGEGADTFVWQQGDDGTGAAPASDTITDFSATEGDVLDISDLLQGEESNDLTSYMSVAESGSDVVIDITPTGSGDTTQTITLENTSLTDLGANPAGTQAEIIQSLVDNGHIHVDM
jgi:Ca2+-binding RTX toxin-like protein